MKYHQANNCLKFINLVGKVNMNTQKSELCLKNTMLNNHQIDVEKPYERLCDEYLTGLFDAEGCVGIRMDHLEQANFISKYRRKVIQLCCNTLRII
jgi:hypothetical protein